MGGEAVWASQHDVVKLMVIKRPSRKCGRRAERAVVPIREISAGVLGCPSIAIVGGGGR